MKKRILLPAAVLLCLALLAGCKVLTQTDVIFDGDSLSKAQKIVVHDAAGNEKAVLTEKADIDAFVFLIKVTGLYCQNRQAFRGFEIRDIQVYAEPAGCDCIIIAVSDTRKINLHEFAYQGHQVWIFRLNPHFPAPPLHRFW